MRHYGFKALFKTKEEYIEMLANSYVSEWLEVYGIEGLHFYLFEPRRVDVVKAWETLLNDEGYHMMLDASAKCFWLTENGDREDKGAPIPFYF